MDYKHFSTEDFVADSYFQRWILSEDRGADVFWKKWLHDHPAQREDIMQAATMLRSMQFNIDEPAGEDVEEVWRDIVKNRSIGVYKLKKQQNQVKLWYAIAASFTLLVVAGLGFFTLTGLDDHILGVGYETDFGETQTITLPDSSTVILGPYSRLNYYSTWWGDGAREINLEGEAYFSVVHTHDHQKFVVFSKDVAVTVLGTKFNVNNRRGENQILLEEGNIRLSVTKEDSKTGEIDLQMEPGELVTVNEGKITKTITPPKKYISWTEGVFVFEKAPLSEVIEMIEDHFGYTVITQGITPEDMIMTAELRSTDLDMMLMYIAEIFQLKIEKTDDTITLKEN
jgi:ferric-dicitrate binding protein FerR (iron transport regulator)